MAIQTVKTPEHDRFIAFAKRFKNLQIRVDHHIPGIHLEDGEVVCTVGHLSVDKRFSIKCPEAYVLGNVKGFTTYLRYFDKHGTTKGEL